MSGAVQKPDAWRLPRPAVMVMAAACVVYVLFCMHQPFGLFADYNYDEEMFARHATSILAGQWLGPFDSHTLVKGPGYSLFLAFNEILGWPASLSQALLYAGSCALMGVTLARLTRAAWFGVVMSVVILWHPDVFAWRMTRDDITPAQLLILLACVLQFGFIATTPRLRWRWGALAGFAFGWLWITRQEIVWVMPGLAVLLGGRAVQLWAVRRRGAIMSLSPGVLAGAAVALLVWGCVATADWLAYGDFGTTDLTSPGFVSAVHELQMVRVGGAQAYVPVPARVRAAVDQVSPAFAALEPYFNGPGQPWTRYGCVIDTSTCGDFAGGWFMFALRDALVWAGQYHSYAQAEAYYRQIGDQVRAACADHRLTCRPTLTAMMPAVTAAQWRLVPLKIRELVALLRSAVPLAIEPSSGDAAETAAMNAVMERPLRRLSLADENHFVLTGWFQPRAGGWLQMRCQGRLGDEVSSIVRLPSPDLVVAFHDPAAGQNRFVITVPDARMCALQASGDDQAPQLPLARPVRGGVVWPGGRVYFDTVDLVDPVPSKATQIALAWVRQAYADVLPPVFALAVLGYVWGAIAALRRRRLSTLWILASAFWVLVLVRCVVLLLIDISAFPAILQIYMMPAFPVLCLAIGCSMFAPWGDDGCVMDG